MQSNNFSELHTTDAFQEGFERFQSSALFERLQDKFRLKPYFERNKLLRQVTAGVSFFLNAFSIATAFFFVFAFLSAILPINSLAVVFAFVSLGLLEGLKRLTIPSFFQRFFQFRQVAFAQLAVIALLTALSVFLSYKGAADAILALTKTPELIDVEAVRAPYLERINNLEAQKADLKKTSTYKGVYTSKGARAAESLDSRIAALDAELLQKTSDAEASNKATQEAHIKQTGLKSEYFAGLALIFDLALILALGWLEYYDFRALAEFAKHRTQKAKDQATAQTFQDFAQTPAPAFSSNGKAHHSATDHFDQAPAQEGSRTVVEGFRRSADQTQVNASDAMRGGGTSGTLKNCEHCQKSFRANTTWQRFCSTQCREENWQNKTGKTLKRRGKSQVFNSMLAEISMFRK